MKRARSMANTAEEGKEFLKERGHKEEEGEGVRTRSSKTAREAAEVLLTPNKRAKKEASVSNPSAYKDKLKMVFRIFDKNKDGKIDKSEFEAIFRSLGKEVTGKKLDTLMKSIDKNKNGFIEMNEFVNYMFDKQGIEQPEEEEEEAAEDDEDEYVEEEEDSGRKKKKKSPRATRTKKATKASGSRSVKSRASAASAPAPAVTFGATTFGSTISAAPAFIFASAISTMTTFTNRLNKVETVEFPDRFYQSTGPDSGVTEVVFSFDTTGSMGAAIIEARKHIRETCERLFKEVPKIRIALIAHGDYCDKRSGRDYQQIDFTNDVEKIVAWITSVQNGTGGDWEENYEFVLEQAQKLNWTSGSNRSLVMIGDAAPHEENDTLTQMKSNGFADARKINWRDEADKLYKMGVKVYGVQCNGSTIAAFFYKAIVARTVGAYVELQNFNVVKDIILSICFREVSPERLHTYEKEIIAEGRMNEAINRMIRQVSREVTKELTASKDAMEVDGKEEEGERASMKRLKSLSIADYFTPHAGLHEVTAEEKAEGGKEEETSKKEDVESDPKFDLGVENAFNGFSVLLYNFNDAKTAEQEPSTLFQESERALRSKGFNVITAKNEEEFLEKLPTVDECWIASAGSDNSKETSKFVEAVKKFHSSGKGLALWAGETPYFSQANALLGDLFGVTLEGRVQLDEKLDLVSEAEEGEELPPGKLDRHLVTTGILKLYEGSIASSPNSLESKNKDYKLEAIGRNSAGKTIIFAVDGSHLGGRVIVDCGLDKLYPNSWVKTSGTERYVRNIGVWLLGLDWRASIGSSMQGDVSDFLKGMKKD